MDQFEFTTLKIQFSVRAGVGLGLGLIRGWTGGLEFRCQLIPFCDMRNPTIKCKRFRNQIRRFLLILPRIVVPMFCELCEILVVSEPSVLHVYNKKNNFLTSSVGMSVSKAPAWRH